MRAAPEVTPLLFWSLVASSCHAFTSKHGLSPFPFPSPAIGIIGAARRRRFRSSTILASTFLDRNRQCTQTQLQRENILSMRKQKASDRRTRRRQRGDIDLEEMPVGVLSAQTLTSNPMQSATWTAKSVLSSSLTTTLPVRNAASGYHSSMYSSSPRPATFATTASTSTTRGGGGGGRGRSLKRTTLYQSLQHYHASFLNPLTCEYQAEVSLWVNLSRKKNIFSLH